MLCIVFNADDATAQSSKDTHVLYASPGYSSDRRGDPYFDVAVKNTIRKHFGDIQKAYLKYLETNPKITDGKVEIDWIIGTAGKVKTPEVIFSSFEGGSLEPGIIKTLSTWKFPPPPNGQQAYVTHSFKLKKE